MDKSKERKRDDKIKVLAIKVGTLKFSITFSDKTRLGRYYFRVLKISTKHKVSSIFKVPDHQVEQLSIAIN